MLFTGKSILSQNPTKVYILWEVIVDIYEFSEKLHLALSERGVSAEDSEKYIERLMKYITPEDVAKTTDDEIAESADICVNLLKKKKAQTVPEKADASAEIPEVIAQPTVSYSISEMKQAGAATVEFKKVSPEVEHAEATQETDFGITPEPPVTYDEAPVTARSKLMLVLITILTSPLWLIAGILFFAPFAVILALEVAVTAVFIGLLAGGSAAGAAASLTGIVYGVIVSFTTPSIGVYEIGFGVIMIGITMIFGILSYNGAVRLMPWVFKKTGILFRFTWSKVKPLILAYKRRCESL